MIPLYSELSRLKFVECTAVTKSIQAKQHRKKRINKKWLKRYGFKDVPDYNKIYFAKGYRCIIAQPKTIEKIKKAVIEYNRSKES